MANVATQYTPTHLHTCIGQSGLLGEGWSTSFPVGSTQVWSRPSIFVLKWDVLLHSILSYLVRASDILPTTSVQRYSTNIAHLVIIHSKDQVTSAILLLQNVDQRLAERKDKLFSSPCGFILSISLNWIPVPAALLSWTSLLPSAT